MPEGVELDKDRRTVISECGNRVDGIVEKESVFRRDTL
jgi:hypothetical protein